MSIKIDDRIQPANRIKTNHHAKTHAQCRKHMKRISGFRFQEDEAKKTEHVYKINLSFHIEIVIFAVGQRDKQNIQREIIL